MTSNLKEFKFWQVRKSHIFLNQDIIWAAKSQKVSLKSFYIIVNDGGIMSINLDDAALESFFTGIAYKE